MLLVSGSGVCQRVVHAGLLAPLDSIITGRMLLFAPKCSYTYL